MRRTESRSNSNSIFLKDRLYLGYQEKADVLEVISYNEDGGAVRVSGRHRLSRGRHASHCLRQSRVVHGLSSERGADILPPGLGRNQRQSAGRRRCSVAQHKDFYGIPVDRGVDVPNAIDNAKLRANRFAVDQLLWNEGCGGNDEPAIRCRAALFMAVLQYRLSGEQQFDRAAASYRDEAAARLTQVSRQRWPGGLAIGDPDLPNRNPLSGASSRCRTRSPFAIGPISLNVAAAFDPLRLRPPLGVWRVADEKDVARLVAGLAEFIAEPDVELLDRELFSRAGGQVAPRARPTAAPVECNRRPSESAASGSNFAARLRLRNPIAAWHRRGACC